MDVGRRKFFRCAEKLPSSIFWLPTFRNFAEWRILEGKKFLLWFTDFFWCFSFIKLRDSCFGFSIKNWWKSMGFWNISSFLITELRLTRLRFFMWTQFLFCWVSSRLSLILKKIIRNFCFFGTSSRMELRTLSTLATLFITDSAKRDWLRQRFLLRRMKVILGKSFWMRFCRIRLWLFLLF